MAFIKFKKKLAQQKIWKPTNNDVRKLAARIKFTIAELRQLDRDITIKKVAKCIDCGSNPHFYAMRILKTKEVICLNCDAIRYYKETYDRQQRFEEEIKNIISENKYND